MATPDTPDECILSSLNEAQRCAVTSTAPTVAILAGPGSGKTHTLTSRVTWLIQEAGYRPADVIVATFTVKAAREMKHRLRARLGEQSEKKIVLGTFHSIARRYLAVYGHQIGLRPKFGIADDADSRAIIQRIIKRLSLPINPSQAKSWISKKKSKGTTPPARQDAKQPENRDLIVCFDEYQEYLARANLLDYDDLLLKGVELLQQHPECVANVQAVLIDEYQDTNGIQYDLMKLFAQSQHRITIVGDPDQSIYGWRSAEIKNLYRFLRSYPQTDEISLQENYRSSQHILDVSLQVIQQDKKRYQKILLPIHTKCTKPVLRKLKTSPAEAEWIVSESRRATTMFGGMLKNEDVAILLRSASLSRHIESALGKAGISYRMVGGHKFYDRKEIKILLDYLRVIHQPDNNDAFARIINVPRRGLGETTIKSLVEEAEQSKVSLWGLLWRHCREGRRATTRIRPNVEQKLNTDLLSIMTRMREVSGQVNEDNTSALADLIEQLLDELNFKLYLETEFADEHEQRWASVEELLSLANDFMRDLGKAEEEALPDIDQVEQVKEDDVLGRFLANVALAADAQSDDKEQDKSSQVTISTIHAAKGLEWPVVFVPAVFDGSIPHSRAEDMDEERRLLYVAMTRAKALLYLSCPVYGSLGFNSFSNNNNKVDLSPFLSPIAPAFSRKGPSFDRPVIEAVGKILKRAAPAESSVFGQMPPMFCPEDDLFPVDPFAPEYKDDWEGDADKPYGRSLKRQKTQKSAIGNSGSAARPWEPDYATTMEQSAEFTMSLASLPGFVTAGDHRSTMAKASALARAGARLPWPQGDGGGASGKTDQQSLDGFVGRKPMAPVQQKQQGPTGSSLLARHPAAASRICQEPTIDPELVKHKMLGVKSMPRPNLTTSATDKENIGKEYACFSSSPPRKESPELPESDVAWAGHDSQRPAVSFHPTTFTSVKPVGGVRRPAGLGPAPSLNRLQKPFKPLTITRLNGSSG